MPQTQDKIGPQDIPSGKDVQKTGRPLPPGQPKIGPQSIDSSQPSESGGTPPPDLSKRGTQEVTPAKANPRRIDDKVSKLGKEY
jgi:hypothetical protein